MRIQPSGPRRRGAQPQQKQSAQAGRAPALEPRRADLSRNCRYDATIRTILERFSFAVSKTEFGKPE
jgi:hypothetical protein